MVKSPTVSVNFDLPEEKQSSLARFCIRTYAVTKGLPGEELLIKVKDSCKQAAHFCVCVCEFT